VVFGVCTSALSDSILYLYLYLLKAALTNLSHFLKGNEAD
jgi:hypothetical protein